MATLARDLKSVLRKLFEDCENSTSCRESYPNLEAKFKELHKRLSAKPLKFTLEAGRGWPPMPVNVDGETFLNMVFSAFYSWRQTERLPRVFHNASLGEYSDLKKLATWDFHRFSPTSASMGVRFSYICNEEVPFVTAEQLEEGTRDTGPLSVLVEHSWTAPTCAAWPSGRADPIEDQPVAGEVPTLFLSGSYDPITPPALSRAAAEHLPNSHVVEFVNVGHGVVGGHPCAGEVMKDFLANPAARPDPPCLQDVVPPDFSESRDDLRRKAELP